jgi:Protein of unknown function (DUF2637)
MHDEDNDGRFPDESPVEVRYPRSKQEEQGDRERWPWLPGTIVEQCGPDEWYVCIEVRELAVLRDGRRVPRGTASRSLYYPCCFRDSSEIPATIGIEWPSGGDAARSEPVSGDRVIRFVTAAVVCAVAAFAAVVSYSHIYGLGRAHGQDGTAARLLPLSVDGLILAASLVLLHEARNDRDAPRLARFMLWLGIGATIGANIAYGAGYGLLGALISAWPAVAFIGSVEIATQQVRRSHAPGVATIVPAVPQVPGDVEQAVRAAYAASVAAGQPLSQRAMAERFGLSRRKVSQIVAQVTASGNGHQPESEAA